MFVPGMRQDVNQLYKLLHKIYKKWSETVLLEDSSNAFTSVNSETLLHKIGIVCSQNMFETVTTFLSNFLSMTEKMLDIL